MKKFLSSNIFFKEYIHTKFVVTLQILFSLELLLVFYLRTKLFFMEKVDALFRQAFFMGLFMVMAWFVIDAAHPLIPIFVGMT